MHGQKKITTESEILNKRNNNNKKNETKIIWSVKNVTLKKNKYVRSPHQTMYILTKYTHNKIMVVFFTYLVLHQDMCCIVVASNIRLTCSRLSVRRRRLAAFKTIVNHIPVIFDFLFGFFHFLNGLDFVVHILCILTLHTNN